MEGFLVCRRSGSIGGRRSNPYRAVPASRTRCHHSTKARGFGRGNAGQPRGPVTMTTLRVLVVEDDAVIGVLLAEMLQEMGHDVCAIEATEAEAVIAAAKWHPDLMIVDVRLGEGSGVAAVDEIHRAGPVPHVFVSADISGIRVLRPHAAMIQKPYREADLAQVIQAALDA